MAGGRGHRTFCSICRCCTPEGLFFGPFYGSYVVFELGQNYDYAFVSGFNRNYLWFLARTPQVSEALRAQFLETIIDLGFESEDLIWLDEPELMSATR